MSESSDLLTITKEWMFIRDKGMLSGDNALDNHWTLNEVTAVMRFYREHVLEKATVQTVLKRS